MIGGGVIVEIEGIKQPVLRATLLSHHPGSLLSQPGDRSITSVIYLLYYFFNRIGRYRAFAGPKRRRSRETKPDTRSQIKSFTSAKRSPGTVALFPPCWRHSHGGIGCESLQSP